MGCTLADEAGAAAVRREEVHRIGPRLHQGTAVIDSTTAGRRPRIVQHRLGRAQGLGLSTIWLKMSTLRGAARRA